MRRALLLMLLLGLPLALLAALHPANEYQATLGIDAVDCDGPFQTWLFAAPALLLYGAGLAMSGLQWRRRANRPIALLCMLVCAAVLANSLSAWQQHQRQAADCGAAAERR